MPAVESPSGILTDDMLERFGERAPKYDRDNTFFHEDFDELKDAGYLKLNIPKEFGGHGLLLADVCKEQRRLAYRAPATALAVNMHLYWMGAAAEVHRSGDSSCDWMLEDGAAGEVFAAGHSETGNDLPLLMSTARAEPVDGGYKLYGHKNFGSLSPVWTRLGIHAADNSDPANPKIVHAFMPRDTEGYMIKDTWDVLGMRATKSDDTILEGAFVPDKYIPRVVAQGLAGADLFVLSIFAWALPNFANIYYAIAERAFDLTVESMMKKTSIALGGREMKHHPFVQHAVADMFIELEGIRPHIERTAEEWSTGFPHGDAWALKFVSTKLRAVEGAYRVVDMAMELSGGGGMFKGNELERLFRDSRAGRFHPANSMLTHEFCGQGVLGVLGEEPRWG